MKILIAIAAAGILAVACMELLGQSTHPTDWHNPYGIAYDKVQVTSVELKDGKLYVAWREESHGPGMWPEGGGPPPEIKAWRDIYCASNNTVVFDRTENGTVTPSSSKTETTPEKTEWPK